MTRSRIPNSGTKKPKGWILILGAIFFVSVELTQSRIPAPEFGRPFGRNLVNKVKRTRGGLTTSRSPIPLPVVTESIDPPDVEDNSISGIDSLLDGSELDSEGGGTQQWLELDAVPPARVSAQLHSEVILECVAIGSPPPIVFWLKDGKPIEALPAFDSEELLNGLDAQVQSTLSGFAMAKIKSQLKLRCIRPEDEGEYSCIATQIDGFTGSGPRRLSSSATVVIDEDDKSQDWKPECEFRLPLDLLTGKKRRRGTPAYVHVSESLHMEVIGNSIVLPCRAGGKPKPRVRWFGSDGEPITIGKKYQINAKGDLIIRNLSWNEMGDYRCQVTNTYGSESASIFLYPLLPEDR